MNKTQLRFASESQTNYTQTQNKEKATNLMKKWCILAESNSNQILSQNEGGRCNSKLTLILKVQVRFLKINVFFCLCQKSTAKIGCEQ